MGGGCAPPALPGARARDDRGRPLAHGLGGGWHKATVGGGGEPEGVRHGRTGTYPVHQHREGLGTTAGGVPSPAALHTGWTTWGQGGGGKGFQRSEWAPCPVLGGEGAAGGVGGFHKGRGATHAGRWCAALLRGGGGGRDALEGKGPQRRLGRRLEEVAKAVVGGYCRLQMPFSLALGVRGTVAGHRLGALEEGGGGVLPPPDPMHPCGGHKALVVGGGSVAGKARGVPCSAPGVRGHALQVCGEAWNGLPPPPPLLSIAACFGRLLPSAAWATGALRCSSDPPPPHPQRKRGGGVPEDEGGGGTWMLPIRARVGVLEGGGGGLRTNKGELSAGAGRSVGGRTLFNNGGWAGPGGGGMKVS